MFNQAACRLGQPRDVHDDFLVMYVDDRIERNTVVATVLDIDEQFASTPRANVPDRAKLIVSVFCENLKAH